MPRKCRERNCSTSCRHRKNGSPPLSRKEQDLYLNILSHLWVTDDTPGNSIVSAYLSMNTAKLSEEGALRAEKILSALFSALVQLGAEITSVSERGCITRFYGVLVEYNIEERTTQYRRKTDRRSELNTELPLYERRFNGRLLLSIRAGTHTQSFSDRDDMLLEYDLGNILQSILELVSQEYAQSAPRTAAPSSSEENDRRLGLLIRDAESHTRAQNIRDYVSSVIAANGNDPELSDWADWALAEANNMDPAYPPPKKCSV